MILHATLFQRFGRLELVLAALVLFSLALPYIPTPWEHETRIAVRFRTAEMTQPSGFTVRTSAAVCYLLSALLPYRDPDGDDFVQIDCGRRAVAPAQQIRAERAALREQAAAFHPEP
jgi:hypothetical protein